MQSPRQPAGPPPEKQPRRPECMSPRPVPVARPWLWRGLLAAAGDPAAGVRVQDHLADPYGVGGDLDALVLAAELQRLLERELARRHQLLELVGVGAHV